MHEGQGGKTRYGSEGGGGYLGNRFGKRRDTGFPCFQGFMLIAEPVAENNCIINSQGKLKHHRHGIGDEGNSSAEEVGSHVEESGNPKSGNQHGYLRVRTGGQGENRHNDDGGNDNDYLHFLL